jgi:hypothetical protein
MGDMADDWSYGGRCASEEEQQDIKKESKMDKLKILEVVKKNDIHKAQNGGTIYSVWAKIDLNGKEIGAKVQAWTEKISLEAGKEYTQGDNCDRIAHKTFTQNGNTHDQYTIYVPKSENGNFSGGKKSGWIPPTTYTVAEFDALFNHALEMAEQAKSKTGEFCHELVSTYLIGAQKGSVKIINSGNVADAVNAAGISGQEINTGSSSDDIPF